MKASVALDRRLLPRAADERAIGAWPPPAHSAPPRILLAATLRWPMAARLAIAFRQLGCVVHAWCPPGHPLEKTQAVERIHPGSTVARLRSLRAALESAAPTLVVPCDDDAAVLLQELYQQTFSADPPAPLHSLIERSLGTPASCALATDRTLLMQAAAGEGVRVPASRRVSSAAELDEACAAIGLPAVLKTNRSWGGLGVTVVRDLEAARQAFRSARHPSLMRALSHLILRRDRSHLMRWVAGARIVATLQQFIPGKPANRAVACWRGEVLAGISVGALRTRTPTGPATVVQVIDNPEMSEAVRRLVRVLAVSGLFGADFIIEDGTGAAYLIEVNPRATPICHLPLGAEHDLPAALAARLAGAPVAPRTPTIQGNVIAMFPGEWQRDPLSPDLRTAFHDVPWTDMGLVRECLAPPWEERGVIARIRAWLKRGRSPEAVALPALLQPTRFGLPDR